MLKIQADESGGETITLQLEGSVIGPWVDEVRRSCDGILAAGTKLALDLSHVSFLDHAGIELLRTLRGQHVVLLNCSRFVAEQLKS